MNVRDDHGRLPSEFICWVSIRDDKVNCDEDVGMWISDVSTLFLR